MSTLINKISVAKLKKWEEADWSDFLKYSIREKLEDSPENYLEEISAFNGFRRDCFDSGKDSVGKDLVIRYFAQIEYLELHVDIEESQLPEFTWYDGVSGEKAKQQSLAFEKANVLFHLAAIFSHLAHAENRKDEAGLKRSFHYLQCSAGLFHFISQNFIHAPLAEISRDSTVFWSKLMLAQAQESFLEKAIVDKKSHGLIAKLANQTALLFDGIDASGKGLEKSLLNEIQSKRIYYFAMANYYKSLAEQNVGIALSRLMKAQELMQETIKLNEKSFFSKSNSEEDITAVMKFLQSVINEKKEKLDRDNELVYHEPVVLYESLPKIDNLLMAKCFSLKEVFNDSQKSIGPDIFARMVSMKVHEINSVFSEEKSKFQRDFMGKIEKSDLSTLAALSKLNVEKAIEEIDCFEVPGKDVEGILSERNRQESNAPIYTLYEKVCGFPAGLNERISALLFQLDLDLKENETKRAQYGSYWQTRVSSDEVRKELLALSAACQEGKAKEKYFANQLEQLDWFLKLDISKNSVFLSPTNLLDSEHFDFVSLKSQIESNKNDLVSSSNSKRQLAHELKTRMIEDDIGKLAILNKNNEKAVIREELEKYNMFHDKLHAFEEKENKLIQSTAKLLKVLQEKKSSDATLLKNLEIKQKIQNSFSAWKLLLSELNEGIRFYENLMIKIHDLSGRIEATLMERKREREQLEKEMNSNKVQMGHDYLRNELLNSNQFSIPYQPSNQQPYQQTNSQFYPQTLSYQQPQSFPPSAPQSMSQSYQQPQSYNLPTQSYLQPNPSFQPPLPPKKPHNNSLLD